MGNAGLVGGSAVPALEWTGDWCVGNAGLVGGSAVPDLEWVRDWSVGNEGLVGGLAVPDLEWTGDWSVGNEGLVGGLAVPDLECLRIGNLAQHLVVSLSVDLVEHLLQNLHQHAELSTYRNRVHGSHESTLKIEDVQG